MSLWVWPHLRCVTKKRTLACSQYSLVKAWMWPLLTGRPLARRLDPPAESPPSLRRDLTLAAGQTEGGHRGHPSRDRPRLAGVGVRARDETPSRPSTQHTGKFAHTHKTWPARVFAVGPDFHGAMKERESKRHLCSTKIIFEVQEP